MSDRLNQGSKLNAARVEIKARREGRELLIRGVLHRCHAATPLNVDELTASIARALREALK